MEGGRERIFTNRPDELHADEHMRLVRNTGLHAIRRRMSTACSHAEAQRPGISTIRRGSPPAFLEHVLLQRLKGLRKLGEMVSAIGEERQAYR